MADVVFKSYYPNVKYSMFYAEDHWKYIAVMDAERNGRRLSPPMDVPPAARKRVPTSAAGASQA